MRKTFRVADVLSARPRVFFFSSRDPGDVNFDPDERCESFEWLRCARAISTARVDEIGIHARDVRRRSAFADVRADVSTRVSVTSSRLARENARRASREGRP